MDNRSFIIVQDKFQFFPGETIIGNVFLKPQMNVFIEDIEMAFKLLENWYCPLESYLSETNNQIISQFNLDIKNIFKEQQNTCIFLQNNTYKFPYKFKLPSFLNPSFEFPSQKYRAYLRYVLEAKIKSPQFSGNTSIYIIIQALKNSNSDFNDNLNVEQSLSIKKWGLIDSGNTILKASYPSKYYTFIDTIPINIKIDNSKSKLKVTECKINFKRTITFRNKDNLTNKKSHTDKLIKKILKWEVKKHEMKNFEYKLYLGDLNLTNMTYDGYIQPYNNQKVCNIELIPSIDSGILKCEYFIKISLYYENFVTKEKRPRIILPVNMVHKLENNHIIESNEEDDIKKAIEESLKEKNKGNENISFQEDDIKKAIEESLKEKNKGNENISFQEEEDIKKAIEESKKEEEKRKNKTVINYSYNNNYLNNNNFIKNINDFEEGNEKEMDNMTKLNININDNNIIHNSYNNNYYNQNNNININNSHINENIINNKSNNNLYNQLYNNNKIDNDNKDNISFNQSYNSNAKKPEYNYVNNIFNDNKVLNNNINNNNNYYDINNNDINKNFNNTINNNINKFNNPTNNHINNNNNDNINNFNINNNFNKNNINNNNINNNVDDNCNNNFNNFNNNNIFNNQNIFNNYNNFNYNNNINNNNQINNCTFNFNGNNSFSGNINNNNNHFNNNIIDDNNNINNNINNKPIYENINEID